MATRTSVTDGSWFSGPRRVRTQHWAMAVLVTAMLATAAGSPAQDATYNPTPVTALENQGAGVAPDGVLPIAGADLPTNPDRAGDPNADG